jgi:branched-chain amino acid transport system permease protein
MAFVDALSDPTVLSLIGINILLCVSLYLPIAVGQFSLGTGAFMGIGAYASSILTVHLGWPVLAAMPVAVVGTALLGGLLGYPALRLSGIYLALATVGLGELVRSFFENLDYVGGVAGFAGMQGISGGEIYLFVVLTLGCVALVRASRIGRIMEAVREDADVAAATGINTRLYKVAAFAAGAGVAAMAGALYAHFIFFISPKDFDFTRSVQVLIFLAFGGTQTVFGAVIGPVILTILLQAFWDLAVWRDVIYGLIIILMMNFMPAGLVTRRHVLALGRIARTRWLTGGPLRVKPGTAHGRSEAPGK